MMLHRIALLSGWILSGWIGTAGLAVAADQSPYEVIEQTATDLTERLDGRTDYLEDNPAELYGLIDEILLPRFDTRYAGYLVLGKKHWRSASKEQRDDFIAAFYLFLLRSYADAILNFDQDNIRIIKPDAEPDGDRTVIKTEMRMDDGSRVPVNYSMRNGSDGWRAYDVRIEGVSYVQNYRNQFNAEITANGINEVIARLEREAVELEVAGLDAEQSEEAEATD
jgi:phospholipid transport system substrate-binding protein